MNPKFKLLFIAFMAAVSAQAVSAQAVYENIIRVHAPVESADSKTTWVTTTPYYTDWVASENTCGAWSPDVSTVNAGVSFEQTRTCSNEETRQVQAREYSVELNKYRNIGETTPETRSVSNIEAKNAVGTKLVISNLKIQNPVAGVNGIYQVKNTETNTTFNAYVNMTYDGGYWVLATYWTSPSQLTRLNSQLVYKDKPLSTYSANVSTYPVIPSNTTNGSTRGMLVSSNSGWVSLFGQWQSFDLLNPGDSKSGYLVKTPIGNKTIYSQAAGWGGNISEGGTFGFWSVMGYGGVCGGAGVEGSSKICPSTNFPNWSSHVEGSSGKFYYLKGE